MLQTLFSVFELIYANFFSSSSIHCLEGSSHSPAVPSRNLVSLGGYCEVRQVRQCECDEACGKYWTTGYVAWLENNNESSVVL